MNPGESIKLGYKFQFHKGTIRTICSMTISNLMRNFNSIKVRLELSGVSPAEFSGSFQFHKGTIRTQDSMGGYYESGKISIP